MEIVKNEESTLCNNDFEKIIKHFFELESQVTGSIQSIAARQTVFEKKCGTDNLDKRIQRLESTEINVQTRLLEKDQENEELNKKMSRIQQELESLRHAFLSIRSSKAEPNQKIDFQHDDHLDDNEERRPLKKSKSDAGFFMVSKPKGTQKSIPESDLFDFEVKMLLQDVSTFDKTYCQQLYDHINEQGLGSQLETICGNLKEVTHTVLEKFLKTFQLTSREQRQIQLDCWGIMTQDSIKGRGRPMESIGLHKRAKEYQKQRKFKKNSNPHFNSTDASRIEESSSESTEERSAWSPQRSSAWSPQR